MQPITGLACFLVRDAFFCGPEAGLDTNHMIRQTSPLSDIQFDVLNGRSNGSPPLGFATICEIRTSGTVQIPVQRSHPAAFSTPSAAHLFFTLLLKIAGYLS